MQFKNYTNNFVEVIKGFESFSNGNKITLDEGINELKADLHSIKKKGSRVYMVGNGASATIASHMAIDFWKNLKIKSQLLHDFASLTAVSNDIAYGDVYSEPLSLYLEKSDLLLTISSSGNSTNLVKAVEIARSMGIKTIAFTGMQKDNKINKLVSLSFYSPADTYGIVESSHAFFLHYIIDTFNS